MRQFFLLDFSNCRTQRQMHEHIKSTFNLPDWYGNNLDALWDVITGMISLPVEITVLFKPTKDCDKTFIEYLGKIISLLLSAQQATSSINIHLDISF